MKRRNFILTSTGLAAGGLVSQFARAAGKPCPPPQVTVGGVTRTSAICPTTPASAGNSTLASVAASMTPGTWSQLTAGNQNAVLGVGGVSGTMIHYCNSMPWNPMSKKIEILAMDHNYGRVRYAQYHEASNQFVLIADDAGFGSAVQHGYDHNVVNPYTGDFYYLRIGNAGSAINAVRKPVSSTMSFTALPTLSSAYSQIAMAACWWSGSFAGAGSQGCFMVFNGGDAFGTANDGQLAAYNPLTNSWFMNKRGMAPFYRTSGNTYHPVMEYSPVHNCAVYGGGNDAPNKLWRLNADGSFTAMPAVPAGKGAGIQRGNLVCDPVTGNFLLLSAGQLWELNPTGNGTWTQLTGSRTPPSAVGIPGPSNPIALFSTAIPDHKVIAYVTQPNTQGGTFTLYKHG